MRIRSRSAQLLRLVFLPVATFALLARAQPGISSFYEQLYDGTSLGAASQRSVSQVSGCSFETYMMDDFYTPNVRVAISDITAFGEQTVSNPNMGPRSTHFRIQQNPSFIKPGTIYGERHSNGLANLSGGTLSFSGLSVVLDPGRYWLSMWVDCDAGLNGQWYWRSTTSGPFLNPAMIHDVGGTWGIGTDPIPVTDIGLSRDLAFVLQYWPVPEPSTLLGTGIALAVAFRRRRSISGST
jgi:hypothetical protein